MDNLIEDKQNQLKAGGFFQAIKKEKGETATQTKFISFVERILDECPNAKVLITCRTWAQVSKEELNIKLDGLNDPNADSWNLFEAHYGKTISKEDKIAFAAKVPDAKLFADVYWNRLTKKKKKIAYNI